jgi:hypothetical protein
VKTGSAGLKTGSAAFLPLSADCSDVSVCAAGFLQTFCSFSVGFFVPYCSKIG